MAEFCKDCFIRDFKPSRREIKRIVVSDPDDLDICEGCGQLKRVVVTVRRPLFVAKFEKIKNKIFFETSQRKRG